MTLLPSLSRTHPHANTQTHLTHTHANTQTHSPLHSHAHTLSLIHTHAFTHSLIHTHKHTLSFTHTHTLSHSHTHTNTHSLTPSHTHTQTYMHTACLHTHSLSLFLSQSVLHLSLFPKGWGLYRILPENHRTRTTAKICMYLFDGALLFLVGV